MKWGHNELQTQQQKYLQCYNNVNILWVVKRLPKTPKRMEKYSG